ncbi:MAG: DUF938 domain-containing protein [Pseudomonadota bacterium]
MTESKTPGRWDSGPRVSAPAGDKRLSAPAAERNRAAIAAAMSARFGAATGTALEIGAGTGQHALALAAALPGLAWIPSDPSEAARESVTAWAAAEGTPNLRPPVDLDAAGDWAGVEGAGPFALIYSANVIHVAPWSVAEGIFRGAGRMLTLEGALTLYGPFQRGGVHTSESNAAFDASLRASNPEWGVRDLDRVEALAEANGLALSESVAMPANNVIQIFRRAAG